MRNRSRFAILGAALLLGGASVVLMADAKDLVAAPAAPGAAQQEQTGEQQDTTENQSGTQGQDPVGASDPVEANDPAGAQVGHQDVPGTPDQTGDNQD